MSLTKISLWDVVKKQFFFKLKSNIDAFNSLVWIQLIGIFFGFNSSSSWSMDGIDINIGYFSADGVIVLSMFWAFVTAITITTKPYRNLDFTFVSNRLSSSLSNILFLFTGSVLAAVTGMLSRFMVQFIHMSFGSGEVFTIPFGIGDFFIGVGATVLYLFLISALGYFIGTLVQVSKLFTFIVPAVIIAFMYADIGINEKPLILQTYFMESSFLLFFIKVLITVVVLFGASMAILNRLEVRK